MRLELSYKYLEMHSILSQSKQISNKDINNLQRGLRKAKQGSSKLKENTK